MPQVSLLLEGLLADTAKGRPQEDVLHHLLHGGVKPGFECRYEGTPQEAKDFVSWLKSAVDKKKKPGGYTSFHVKALEMIEAELQGNPYKRAFMQIDPVKFYIQQAFRIVDPKLIYQSKAELCATVATVVQMATTQPVPYAKLGRDLLKNGTTKLGQVTIEPHPVLRRARSVGGLAECDYVTLTSIRNSAASVESRTLNLGGLTPNETCNWLRLAGYFPVENHTIKSSTINKELGWHYPEGVTSERALRKMAKRFEAGFNVLVWDDAAISHFVTNNETMPNNLGSDRHLVYVNTLSVDNDYVNLKLYSWCEARQTKIKKDAFLVHFLGFIAYKDR